MRRRISAINLYVDFGGTKSSLQDETRRMAINILFHLFRSGLFSMHTGKGMRCWFILLLFFSISYFPLSCLFVMGSIKNKTKQESPGVFYL